MSLYWTVENLSLSRNHHSHTHTHKQKETENKGGREREEGKERDGLRKGGRESKGKREGEGEKGREETATQKTKKVNKEFLILSSHFLGSIGSDFNFLPLRLLPFLQDKQMHEVSAWINEISIQVSSS